jgi:hypothetical protein
VAAVAEDFVFAQFCHVSGHLQCSARSRAYRRRLPARLPF